ncbi:MULTISPECIES: LysR family transcriptional regulator [unclassified Caballeronia]|uniref:LysR family transcriptional regulator n=1 Tax=unclassified Caballeronia TaxID=2646786 RepID=UPI002854DF2D|nr:MULTISPECIES: LysR family transcriptional regulator [unclassified Caballeronia]MDR5739306.1 LysR family transcriptional regulator [Caballeronia sp. LZ016]MDR5807795.1 LysR family transcriptional regulator [Caballeronia sp. LZ019]
MKNSLDVLMSRLRMKQLQLLIALDEHKSLHKASSAMAMTQSAASKALAELESMLEAPLFERAKSGLIPNPFGRCVIRYARVLAADLNALCQEVAQIRAGTGGRLSVGTIMGAVSGVVAPIVNRMHAKHPDLAIEIIEDTSANMLVMLDDGRVDLVIGRASVSDQPSKYHYQPLTDEPLCVVVGRIHAEPGAGEIGFAELANHRWVTYPSYLPMSALLERELDLAGLPMPANPISTASPFVTVTLLQESPELVSILPASVARVFETHGMLRVLPVRMKSKSQTYGVVTRKGGALSPAARQFVQMLRETGRPQ